MKYPQMHKYLCLNTTQNFIPISYFNFKTISDLLYIYHELTNIISKEVFILLLLYI